MSRILIQGGRVVDPSQGLDAERDILIDGERVEAVGPALARREPRLAQVKNTMNGSRIKALVVATLLASPTWSFAQSEEWVGRMISKDPRRYGLSTDQSFEHLPWSSTTAVRREHWKLRCQFEASSAPNGANYTLKRLLIDPCGVDEGRGTTLEPTEHSTAAGSLKVTAYDLAKGQLEFDILDLGGSAAYGPNQLHATLRFAATEDAVALLGISAKGRWKLCRNDDSDPVTLLPPERSYDLQVPVHFKAGPRGDGS